MDSTQPEPSLDFTLELPETIQLDLGNDKTDKYPKATPVQTKTLASVSLTYSDGTSAEFKIELEQGFHRVTDLKLGENWITEHEVYFTYGE